MNNILITSTEVFPVTMLCLLNFQTSLESALKVTERTRVAEQKVSDANFPDWMRLTFIKRRNIGGS